ncbi:META domain-containing protein [Pseudarthrobacter sp. NIBRBAC000502772]|nr:META domain-containing protein [Pseudarthrobacter sp. NIBRBAC000502772]
MEIRIFTAAAFAVAGIGIALSSCAVQSVPEGTTSLSAAPSARDSIPVTSPATELPLACSLPKEFLETCGSYRSVSGSGIMEWTAERPVTLRLDQTPGSVLVSLTTPCNPISAPAAISSETLTINPSGMTAGAKGCNSPEKGMETAAVSFLQSQVNYTSQGSLLLLENVTGSIELQLEPAAPAS